MLQKKSNKVQIDIFFRRVKVNHLTDKQKKEKIEEMQKKGWKFAGIQMGQYLFESKNELNPDSRKAGLLF